MQVVSVLLSKHVLMNYSKFVRGIDDIAAFEADLKAAYARVQNARTILSGCKDDLGVSMKICEGTFAKLNAGQALDIARKLQRTRDIAKDLRCFSSSLHARLALAYPTTPLSFFFWVRLLNTSALR